jgi:pyruvate formate lyase activating enzyme
VLSRGRNFPIKGFIETSFLDWRGELSSVVFLGGCNFRCPFCHNSDLVLRHHELDDVHLEHIILTLRKYKQWVDKVVITGGEPTIHMSLFNIIGYIKREGVLVKLDTNGSDPNVVKGLVNEGLVDYIAMDVKGPLDQYDKWCGAGVDRTKIEESIRFIMEGRVDYEFRMTVVPFLHREDDVYEVARVLKGARRFYVQPFQARNTISPVYRHIQPHSPDKVEEIRQKVDKLLGVSLDRTEAKGKSREIKAFSARGGRNR